jgi:MFS transporter, AAHS family, 4-hydroxybenzoate transporter
LFFGGGIAFVSLAYSGSATVWVMASVLFLGVFVFGSQIALNGVTTIVYPPAIRATGLSWAIAVGRIGGASGPIVTGLLLQSGFSAAQVLLFGALPASLAVIAAFCLVMNGAELHDEMQEVAG